MHDRMESLADLYAAGALTPDERREADAHAASCPSCAALLREATDFRGWMTGTLAPDAPPADLEDRVIAGLRASSALKAQRWRLVPWKRILIKAVGGLAAAVGFVFLGNCFSPAMPDANGSYPVAYYRGTPPVYRYNSGPTITWKDIDDSVYKGNYTADLRRTAASFGTAQRWKWWGKDSGPTDAALEAITAPKTDKDMPGVDVSLAENSSKAAVMGERAKLAEKASGTPVMEQEKAVAEFALTPPARPAPWIPSAEKAPGVSTLAAAYDDPVEVFEPRPLQDNRKIVRNAEAAVEVDSYDAAYAKVLEVVAAEKGYVSSGDIQKMPNGKIQANVTIRVPAERFDAVLAKLKELGTVKYQNIKAEDVTKLYFDLQAKLKSKELLLERLKTILKEAKGTAKELMEVEVQIGTTQEAIDQIKGELRYYDSVITMSTIILGLVEKDLGQPFEYVQTLQSAIGLTARDVDAVYAKAQKEIADVGGQVVDSKMNRQSDGSATGTIKARVDAEKFPAVREALRKLGHVTNDTVNQQKSARGGAEGTPKPDAPLKKEQAVIDLTIATPPLVVTRRARVLVENAAVQKAYLEARKTIEAAGGTVLNGSLAGREERPEAALTARIDAADFAALVEKLKAQGQVKMAEVKLDLPPSPAGAPAPLLREQGDIELGILPPPELIGEEHGIGKTIRDTFAGSWKGILWSVEKLFVGLSLAGPWLALLVVGWLAWRRFRKKKPGVA